MAVWEAVAYLVPDQRRREVYDRLVAQVGTDAAALAAMPRARLAELIADGGMQPDRRAEKLQLAADLALEVGRDQLHALCRSNPRKARALLRKFPGIGEPGADKMLLFNRGQPGLAPDSNGLRVLVRLGFGAASDQYPRMYRSAAQAVAPELPNDFGWMIRAHQLLRRHGQELCKTNEPRCPRCPLAARCPGRV